MSTEDQNNVLVKAIISIIHTAQNKDKTPDYNLSHIETQGFNALLQTGNFKLSDFPE